MQTVDTTTRARSRVRMVAVAALACLAGGAIAVGSGLVLAAAPDRTAPSSLIVIDPYRAYDTRLAEIPSKLTIGGPFGVHPQFNQSQPEVPVELPDGIVAVAFNVTVADTEGAGFVLIDSMPLTEAATSTVNWSGPNQTVANSGVTRVAIGDDGTPAFGFLVGGTPDARANVIIDVTGFYVET